MVKKFDQSIKNLVILDELLNELMKSPYIIQRKICISDLTIRLEGESPLTYYARKHGAEAEGKGTVDFVIDAEHSFNDVFAALRDLNGDLRQYEKTTPLKPAKK